MDGVCVCTCARALQTRCPHLRNDCTDYAEIWFAVRGACHNAYSHKLLRGWKPILSYVRSSCQYKGLLHSCTYVPHVYVHTHIAILGTIGQGWEKVAI